MTPGRALLLSLLALSGCAMQSAAPVASRSVSASPTHASASVPAREEAMSGSAGGASNATFDASAGALRPFGSLSSTPGGAPARGEVPGLEDERIERDRVIAQWESEIERQRAGLSASLAQCRDICAAAGNVCTAASEICRLTGDLSRANARDARCTRARTACLDAGRRRDGACPVCPAR